MAFFSIHETQMIRKSRFKLSSNEDEALVTLILIESYIPFELPNNKTTPEKVSSIIYLFGCLGSLVSGWLAFGLGHEAFVLPFSPSLDAS